MKVENIDYWNEFYAQRKRVSPIAPSQFAAFTLGEAPDASRVIEFGCGNGRDSRFFASYGMSVIATDASTTAIELCQTRFGNNNPKFSTFCLSDNFANIYKLDVATLEKTIIYARFFMHAISADEECAFLKLVQSISVPGTILALEYRCAGDVETPKEFGEHFRRNIDHETLCSSIEDAGFSITYEIKGLGFAKYKSEDAFIGRCIAVKI